VKREPRAKALSLKRDTRRDRPVTQGSERDIMLVQCCIARPWFAREARCEEAASFAGERLIEMEWLRPRLP
jgi:hypothetical protein